MPMNDDSSDNLKNFPSHLKSFTCERYKKTSELNYTLFSVLP